MRDDRDAYDAGADFAHWADDLRAQQRRDNLAARALRWIVILILIIGMALMIGFGTGWL